jgi:hypothetical protein
MQPMMGKLDRLIELLEQQNAFLVAQAHRRRQT